MLGRGVARPSPGNVQRYLNREPVGSSCSSIAEAKNMPKREDERAARLHPPYCTCVDCTQERLRKIQESSRISETARRPLDRRPAASARRLPSRRRALAAGLRNLRRRVMRLSYGTLVVLISVYAFLVVIHLINGLSFPQSFKGGFQDYRLALECPSKPSAIWAFVSRSQLEHVAVQWSLAIEEDTYGVICQERV